VAGFKSKPVGEVEAIDRLALDVELQLIGGAVPIRTGLDP
jgi:hypothetical protein